MSIKEIFKTIIRIITKEEANKREMRYLLLSDLLPINNEKGYPIEKTIKEVDTIINWMFYNTK